MTYDPHPLHPSTIRPGDLEYRVDLTPETQETLRRRAQQVHPTMATTVGRREWRWGRRTDGPSSSSGSPRIFSPSMLEPGGGSAEAPTPSIADVVKRLKP